MNYDDVRKMIGYIAKDNYEDLVKALVSFENGIDDEKVLDKIFVEFMDCDGVGLLNDYFDHLINDIQSKNEDITVEKNERKVTFYVDQVSELDCTYKNITNVSEVISTTNEIGYLGAAALFYPNQMKKIAASLGGNYFVLPSSIHEVLVLPDYGNFNYMELEQMVKVVNKTTVDRKNQLSNNVYYYDSKEKLFSLASEHEKRSKNIDNKSVNSKKNIDDFLDRTKKFSKDNDVSKENISKNNEIEL